MLSQLAFKTIKYNFRLHVVVVVVMIIIIIMMINMSNIISIIIRIYLNPSKSTQSAAGMNVLKPAANGHYLMWKSLPLLFTFTVQKYIYLPVRKVHAVSFHVSVFHRTVTWTAGSWLCVRDHSYACVYPRRLGTPIASQQTFLTRINWQFVLVFLTGFELRVIRSRVRRFTDWATPNRFHCLCSSVYSLVHLKRINDDTIISLD